MGTFFITGLNHNCERVLYLFALTRKETYKSLPNEYFINSNLDLCSDLLKTFDLNAYLKNVLTLDQHFQ